MKSFHQLLVDQIQENQLADLKGHCFVFPTKRGGVFFKRALIQRYGHHDFMLPTIYSIEDFVQRMTGLTITDELTLLFHLFKVYQKRDKDLQFDAFYAWGKVILKDYDEIDRYLANAKEIYSALQNIKEIDHVFGYNDEFREIISRFRTLTEKQEKTKLLTEFLKIWKEVGAVYEDFQTELLQEEKAYGGILYRNLANVLSQDHFDHPFDFYHICGFNALSKSEEVIFDALMKAQKAQLYWDMDAYYVDERKEEAGDFIREYQAKWPESLWFNADSLRSPKAVTTHSVPQNMAQAHLAARIAGQLLQQGAKPEETAIVLADEKLLVPFLYAMPLHNQKVNVTMGYPMKSTIVFDFVMCYLELIRKAQATEQGLVFHTYDLRPFLSNAYTAVFQEGIYQSINEWFVSEKKTKITAKELMSRVNTVELSALLEVDQNWEVISVKLQQYLTSVFYAFKEKDSAQTDREFIYFFLKSLNQLNDYLKGKDAFTLKLIKKIIQEHFRAVKIPFEGEPVQGVQVMGFLETRTLDFKHLIIVSANEEKLPAARNANSYIPYGLRKVFTLPTFEEQDAIYAYHFKRLLQRAEEVHFIYDNTTQGDSTGERSRFILQQLRRYKKLDGYTLAEQTYEGFLTRTDHDNQIVIEKDEPVMSMLNRFVEGADENKFLSPTSLTNYVTCPLKFYLNNVASFRELDDVEEDIDARNLGIVVHEVLEFIYKPWVGREMNAEQVRLQKGLVEKQLIDALERNKIVQTNQQLSGRDLVTKQVMEQMIQKVLDLDAKDAPFKVVGLEAKEYETLVPVNEIGKVRLSGTIDRMDEKSGALRVIDYKTGNVEFVGKTLMYKDTEAYLDKYFEDPKFKSGFQGYLYAVLTKERNQPVKVGITSMRKLSEGTQWLRDGKEIPAEVISGFESRLFQLVNEIYDQSIPFTQTTDLKRCEYCEFQQLCRRGG